MPINKNKNLASAIFFLFNFIFLAILVEIINFIMHHKLCNYGIFPRQPGGLIGILTAPFLHYGWDHLLTNIIAILLLGGTVILFYSKQFLKISMVIILLGGLGVWIIGREAYHVGASGLIFGYFGFLISRGIYERTFAAIALSLSVILVYGGMIYGIFPISPYVSWEAHLTGFIAGIVSARAIGR